ncbi:uncharacterized protein [Nicotiana tomentosiformis]|uniref:uncharacterized protein n=1 Tax=Nicotiana tomentosiformis TaxID=4098 RepID=UPI00388CBF35
MDVYNAFLQGDLIDEIYMKPPQGFQSQRETKVCRLIKSLYRLACTKAMECKVDRSSVEFSVHSELDLIEDTKNALQKAFKMKHLSELKYFQGIKFARTMSSAVAELTWLLGMLKEIGFKFELPVTIYSDSKDAIQIAANPVFHERTKYIEIGCHFIRENILQGLVKTEYINTT